VAAAFRRLFRWTGALLFGVSLAYFLLRYLTAFGALALDGPPASAGTWNVMLFTTFALHHSIFARERIRRWMAQTVAPDLERSVYVWVASLLFLLVCAWWRPVPGVAWHVDGVAVWLLRGVQAAGLWLVARSAAVLDIRELAGLRPQASGPSLRPPGPEGWGLGPPVFRTAGPYGWVRHPIYAGWFLFVLAAAPMTMTRLVFAIVSCAYLLIAIPFEEHTMRATSQGAYDRYITQVPWRLVPGVY
jgi:protein-S-isoprenylcysteine O-methyltransferase Ste14